MNVTDLITRIRQIGLDEETPGFYSNEGDIIPAINSSIEWCVSVLNPVLGQTKFSEDVFADITRYVVFQTSKLGRVQLDFKDLYEPLWTILGVFPKPTIYIRGDIDLVSLHYYSEIIDYINKQSTNLPIVSWAYGISGASPDPPGGGGMDGGVTPFGTNPVLLYDYRSTIRPELVHMESNSYAERQSIEEFNSSKFNSFKAGAVQSIEELQVYAYTTGGRYENVIVGGYQFTTPLEIELKPRLNANLVTLAYLEVPKLITSEDDTISLPMSFMDVLAKKSIQTINIKEGDQVLYQMTEKDVMALIQSKT